MVKTMEAVRWVMEHWDLMVGVVVAVLGVGTLITKFTKTPRDDEWMAKALAFVSRFASVTNGPGVPGMKLPGQPARQAAPSGAPFQNMDLK